VHVSADNRFRLHVNGRLVGEGPALGDPGHWRFETYDLAPLLHAGRNLLAATIWNYGEGGPISQMSERAGFVLQGDSDAEQAANTNATWEVEQERGITFVPPTWNIIHQYYAAPPGERVDGTPFDWQWDGESPGQWQHAVALGQGSPRGVSDAPNAWALVPNELPAMEMQPVAIGRVVRHSGVSSAPASVDAFTIAANQRVSLLIDTGALTTAYPELTISGGQGARVRLTYSEALYDAQGHKANRNLIGDRRIIGVFDEVLPDGRAHRVFRPFAWRTWRYVQLDIETAAAPLTIDSLRAFFTAYPFTERARFDAHDETLTRIWQVGWHTARLCAHDTYMDTPYWERLQYGGDTRIQMLISYVVAGDERLALQAMNAIDDSRIPDGITQSRYPSSLPQYIPTFSLMWIGMMHDYWMYRPDEAYLRRMVPRTRAVLDWFAAFQRPDGLLARPQWWNFVDWTDGFDSGVPPQDADGGSSALTLQFIEGLRDAADLEQVFGEGTRATHYRELADKAAQGIRTKCWNSGYGLIADTPAQSHFSQHANILGVWLDVVPREQQRAVMQKVLAVSDSQAFRNSEQIPHMSTASYYFRFYLARALDHAGMADDYLKLLGPWRQMLDLGLTTWAETPGDTRSDSHAWSAHPNYDFLTLVAGIRPASPGFAQVTIEPHLGDLKQVDAAMPHPSGLIVVSYRPNESTPHADITLPGGLTGTFVWNGQRSPLHDGTQTVPMPR
jgi:hypothetical protein